MGHKSFALTSCVAAVPAAVLCYFLVVNGFLQHVDKMNVKMLVLVGFTLFLSACVAVTPAGILIFGAPRKRKPAVESRSSVAPAAALAGDSGSAEGSVAASDSSAEAHVFDSSDSVAAFESSGEPAAFDSDVDMVDDGDELELDATTAFSTPAAGSDIDLGDSDTLGEGELSEFDEIDDEVLLEDDEDEPPTRKKKK